MASYFSAAVRLILGGRLALALGALDGVRVVPVGRHLELGLIQLGAVCVAHGRHFVQRLFGGVDGGTLEFRPVQLFARGDRRLQLRLDQVVDALQLPFQ